MSIEHGAHRGLGFALPASLVHEYKEEQELDTLFFLGSFSVFASETVLRSSPLLSSLIK